MNKQEVLKIMAIIEVAYPGWTSKLDNDKKQILINLWVELLSEDNADLIANALKSIIVGDTNPYPPTIGQIRNKAHSLTTSEMSEMEAWGHVMKALKNSGRCSKEEWAKLPPIVQGVVTPDLLKEWSQMDTEQVNTVVSSNFMRSFKARSSTVKTNDLLPQSIKGMLGEFKERFKLENKEKIYDEEDYEKGYID